MNNPTNDEKETIEKVECPFCKRSVAPSYLKTHQKTKICLEAQQGKEPQQSKKSTEVLNRYKEQNQTKRQRLILAIGIDAVREQERIAKQLLRAKKTTPVVEVKEPETKLNSVVDSVINELKSKGLKVEKIMKKVVSQPKQELKKEITPPQSDKQQFLNFFIDKSKIKNNNTAIQYVNDFYKFSIKYTGGEPVFTNLDWLKKYDDVFSFILKQTKPNGEKYQNTSIRSLLTALGSITSVLGDSFNDVSSKYNALAKNYSKNIQKKQMDNLMTENQKLKSIEWNKLIKINNNKSSLISKVIFSIYTLLIPRRAKDYRLMKVIIKKNKKDTINIEKLDTNYNYIICSDNMLPTRLVFNVYKGSDRKTRYYIDKIPSKLANILKEYIISNQLKTDDFLFYNNTKTESYPQGSFSTLVSEKLHEYTGQPLTINSLRHSYASHVIGQNLSQNDLEQHAKAMGTSVGQLMNVYKKIDIK